MSVLLTATVLASGPIYADAVTTSAVRATLNDAPVASANLRLTAPAGEEVTDAQVVAAVDAALQGVDARLVRSERSYSYALPSDLAAIATNGQPADGEGQLTELAWFEELEEHATLTAGDWPANASGAAPGTIDVALPQPAAQALELNLGDRLALSPARRGAPVDARVRGFYTVKDRRDPLWWDEALALEGVETAGNFITYGPLAVTREALERAGSSRRDWYVAPRVERLSAGDLGPMGRGVAALAARRADGLTVDSDLPALLTDAEDGLVATRAGVLLVLLAVTALAVYAVTQSATLLIEHRTVETALLRSRGASARQLGGAALVEALVLAVPAALVAPPLAAFALRALDRIGPLASAGLPLAPQIVPSAYALAALGAAAAVASLATPVLRAASPTAAARRLRSRRGWRGRAQRAGTELALLVLAGVAYWRLRAYGGAVTEAAGTADVDPLLVAVPALGLAAGAVVALRTVPVVAWLAERYSGRGRGLVSALSSWQLARRPLDWARTATVPLLALALGLFTLTYTSTWSRSQADQAEFAIGTDVRVLPDARPGAPATLALAAGYADVDGVEALSAIRRDSVGISRDAGSATTLAVDASTFSTVARLRDDLAPSPLRDLAPKVSVTDIGESGVELPPDADALGATLTATPTGGARADDELDVAVVLGHRSGVLARVDVGVVPLDGQPHRLRADLPVGRDPLRLVAVELEAAIREPVPGETTIAVEVPAITAGDRELVLPATWRTDVVLRRELGDVPPRLLDSELGDGGLRLRLDPGAEAAPMTTTLVRLTGAPQASDVVPLLATERYLETLGVTEGDVVDVKIDAARIRGRIVGVLDAVPTVRPDAGAGAVVLDYAALAAADFARDGSVVAPDEWWLATESGSEGGVVATLAALPFSSREVQGAESRAAQLRTDPVALGLLGALTFGTGAAIVLAVVGFAVSTMSGVRSRIAELSLLRAVGLSTRQLAGSLSLEHAAIAGFSVAAGAVIGLVLPALVLPLAPLGRLPGRPVPAVIVVVPWVAAVALAGALVGALVAAVALLVARLRRRGLGQALRIGEDR